MLQIEQISLDAYERAIVISDIHGDLQLLKQLLEKVSFAQYDALFIVGDLCEKGPNSLEVVRYLKQLQMDHPAVFVIKGNGDILIEHVWKGNDAVFDYMKEQSFSLLHDLLREKNARLAEFPTIEHLQSFYKTHFKDELDWLTNLPEAFETEDYIFIHAGIEDRTDWEETSYAHALTVPSFYEQGHQATKKVIVGHWPVSNYRSISVYEANPLIDPSKRIICIDGGNQVKRNGQLNALIIEGDVLTSEYVDHLTDQRTVQTAYNAPEDRMGAIVYPNYELTPIEEGHAFSLCEHNGVHKWVKNEYIIQEDEKVHCKGDVSTTFVSVQVGDVVSVIDASCASYILIKKNGVIGWIPHACL